MTTHDDALPALPKPRLRSGPIENRDWFDAEQMRAYARQAVALWQLSEMAQEDARDALAARGGQEPVGEIVGTEKRGFALMTLVRWEPGFNRTAIGTKLYAAPPALPAEAVQAMRGALSTAERLRRSLDDGHFEDAVEEAAAIVFALRAAVGEGA